MDNLESSATGAARFAITANQKFVSERGAGEKTRDMRSSTGADIGERPHRYRAAPSADGLHQEQGASKLAATHFNNRGRKLVSGLKNS